MLSKHRSTSTSNARGIIISCVCFDWRLRFFSQLFVLSFLDVLVMFKTELINQFADIKKINLLTLWFLAFDNRFFDFHL